MKMVLSIFCSSLLVSFLLLGKSGMIVALVMGLMYSFLEMNLYYVYDLSFSMLSSELSNLMILLSFFLFFMCLFLYLYDKMFFAMNLFLLLVLCLIFKVNKIVWFYFLYEASVIPLLLMIIFRGYSPERYSAATWMVVYTVGGSMPFLFLMVKDFLKLDLWGGSENLNSSSLLIYTFILLLPFLVKFPMFGVHYWLPMAHVEAPLVGSMLLAGIMLKLGGYGLFILFNLFIINFKVISFMSVWCLVGFCIICFNIMECSDVKKFIALSSVAHMSVSIMGMSFQFITSVMSSICMLFGHGLCSSMMFFMANSAYNVAGSRALMMIKGMLNFIPMFCMWFFLFNCVNMAAPPSLNFISELYFMPSLMYFMPKFLFFFIFFCFFLSALYSMFLYFSVCHGKGLNLISVKKDFKSIENTLSFITIFWLFITIIFLWLFN